MSFESMEWKCEEHLQTIKHEFTSELDAKYRAGQKEHGGRMWEKAGMIDHAIEEAIDQVVYLYTLRAQLTERGIVI